MPPFEGDAAARFMAEVRPPMSTFPAPFGPSRFRRAPASWRKLGAFAGPGYLVAVGWMDPGNWATDLAGGSKALRLYPALRHPAVEPDRR